MRERADRGVIGAYELTGHPPGDLRSVRAEAAPFHQLKNLFRQVLGMVPCPLKGLGDEKRFVLYSRWCRSVFPDGAGRSSAGFVNTRVGLKHPSRSLDVAIKNPS